MTKQEALYLVELAQETLEALPGQPREIPDEEITSGLRQRGISQVDSSRILALVPVAFGRAILQQQGVTFFAGHAIVSHPGGQTTKIQLSDQPIFVAAVRVGVISMHHGSPTPRAFEMLAHRSVEVPLIMNAIHSGVAPERAPQPAIGFHHYNEDVFSKPPWWRRSIF